MGKRKSVTCKTESGSAVFDVADHGLVIGRAHREGVVLHQNGAVVAYIEVFNPRGGHAKLRFYAPGIEIGRTLSESQLIRHAADPDRKTCSAA